MTYVVTSKCIGTCDTACVDVCPCDCIVGVLSVAEIRALPADQRGARLAGIQMFIDPDECIDCVACVAECPVDAIVHESDLPPAHQGDLERNAAFFRRR